ncbi:putative membrane protein SirB2 [Mesorhizobium robiniae]|uniref:Membrane protein SirB2 n=1 Tax=Mesorhizobium robiniae TaxID=559315 RepID=A0ABV2GQ67_9HYPH
MEYLRPGNISYARMFVLLWVAVYVIMFVDVYIDWASVSFFYLGFSYVYNENDAVLAYCIIAAFAFILPVSIKRYSDFFCWMLYLTIFIPSVLIVARQGYTSFEASWLIVSVAASFFLIVYIPKMIHFKSYSLIRQVSVTTFFFFFLAFYLAAIAFYVATYRGMMSLSGMDEIYDQRARFGSAQTSTLALYLTGWLSNAMNPYLLAVGLFDRTRRWAIALGLVGQILVFMAFAGKMMLVILIVTFGFYFFVLSKGRIAASRLAFGFVALTFSALAILIATNYQPVGPAMDTVALIYMRTLGIQGAMTGVYADAFSVNPLTYWSHVNIINMIIDYPYKVPLGYVAGAHLVGGSGFNANANFWATDGVAAYGLAGVVIMGVVLGLLLSLANKVVTPDRLPFAATVSIPFIMSLGNSSLFTSLITGGGLIMVMMIAYGVPQPQAPRQQGIAYRDHAMPSRLSK